MSDVLAPPDEETVEVETLTDEELSVLVAPGGIAVMPFLNGLGEPEQDVARRSAYRSLLARGIVDRPTSAAIARAEQAGTGELDLLVRDDVRSVVALREGARLVVAVARTTSEGQDFWYAHLVEEVAVVEAVSADGLHRFSLARSSTIARTVADTAVHPDARDSRGEPVALETGDDGLASLPEPVLASLGGALLRADVVVRHLGDEAAALTGVFSGPGGTYLTSAEPGQAPVTRPVAADEARRRLMDAVEAGRAAVDHG
jgi:hypothetical protein